MYFIDEENHRHIYYIIKKLDCSAWAQGKRFLVSLISMKSTITEQMELANGTEPMELPKTINKQHIS